MAEDEAATNGGSSHQAPAEDVEVQRRQQLAGLSSIPEGAEAAEEDEEDAMVGPVLPKARKRRVSWWRGSRLLAFDLALHLLLESCKSDGGPSRQKQLQFLSLHAGCCGTTEHDGHANAAHRNWSTSRSFCMRCHQQRCMSAATCTETWSHMLWSPLMWTFSSPALLMAT